MTTTRTPPAWRRAFLRELARTGNVTSAARACNVDQTFPYQLRRRNAAFAKSWNRALDRAREGLQANPRPLSLRDTCVSPPAEGEKGGSTKSSARLREGSKQGRPVLRPDEIVRNSKTGKCRIVRVKQGRWSAKVEAAFLAELTATANVSAAARAAGVTLQCVYMRRKHYPAFKAEWDAAVAEGFARIETLVVCAATTTLEPEPLPDRAWEEPRMTMDQALKVWLTHRAGGPGARKRRLGGVARREPDIEEVRQEIMRKVAAIRRARAGPS
jgi:hypothetical protein